MCFLDCHCDPLRRSSAAFDRAPARRSARIVRRRQHHTPANTTAAVNSAINTHSTRSSRPSSCSAACPVASPSSTNVTVHASEPASDMDKWLFTPVDCSVLYTRHPDALRGAFSLTAEYLRTTSDDAVVNFMDYGLQLGRRFRSLKL